MIADTEKIAVIATRLPYIDRRSLSEAWFSALHLASDGPPAHKPPERRGAAQARTKAAPPPASAAASPEERVTAGRSRNGADSREARLMSPSAAMQPRLARAGATREAFSQSRSYAPFRTSLTFGVHGERVALSLRREGATLHVIAVCRPDVEGIVRRALACVDLYLRVRGESVRASVKTVAQEEIA